MNMKRLHTIDEATRGEKPLPATPAVSIAERESDHVLAEFARTQRGVEAAREVEEAFLGPGPVTPGVPTDAPRRRGGLREVIVRDLEVSIILPEVIVECEVEDEEDDGEPDLRRGRDGRKCGRAKRVLVPQGVYIACLQRIEDLTKGARDSAIGELHQAIRDAIDCELDEIQAACRDAGVD